MFDLVGWWESLGDRLPLPGKLTDYAASVQRYNRALSLRSNRNTTGGTFTFAPDTNRVAIFIAAEFALGVSALSGFFQWIDAGGNVLWGHQVIQKAADVASVTPSPPIYVPLCQDVTQVGPIIANGYKLQNSNLAAISAIELLLNPSMDASQADVK